MDERKIILISNEGGFMADTLGNQLKAAGFTVLRTPGDSGSVDKVKEGTEAVIYFIGDSERPAISLCAYLKRICGQEGRRLYIIGKQENFDSIGRMLPAEVVTMYVTRPFNMTELVSGMAAAAPGGGAVSAKKRVLVVDDDGTFLRAVGKWLEGDFAVSIVSSGKDALAYLTRQGDLPDLVLLDYRMPEMDGPAVIGRMKADERISAVPVIFLTGQEEPGFDEKLRALGAEGYLLKSLMADELRAAVGDFFSGRSGN